MALKRHLEVGEAETPERAAKLAKFESNTFMKVFLSLSESA